MNKQKRQLELEYKQSIIRNTMNQKSVSKSYYTASLNMCRLAWLGNPGQSPLKFN